MKPFIQLVIQFWIEIELPFLSYTKFQVDMSLFLGVLAWSIDLFVYIFANNEGGFINTEVF